MPTEDDLRALVATACRIIYRLGLSDYLGHPSARVAGTDRVVIKPKHSVRIRGMDTMSAADMVVVDLDGTLIEGEDPPPSEVFIHTEIYRARPDVLAVVHTHQPVATELGVYGVPILPILHIEAPLVEEPVPTWPSARMVVTPELGRELAQAVGAHRVCHLQGHGIVSVADSVQEATLGAIYLERLAKANLTGLQIGRQPRVIPPDEIADLRRTVAAPAGRWAYYVELAGGTP
jgi:ribulose-5-phosphate 4-epimerase/fuculose-1-phosphate aldolase